MTLNWTSRTTASLTFGMKVRLPDWLAAVRLLQASTETTLSVTSYVSIQTCSCKVLEKWGKPAHPVRLHPLEGLSSEQTLQRGKQHFVSRKAQPAEQTKLCKQEAALCKAEWGRWAPVPGHMSAATVTLKWLSSLSSSFVSAPVQLQWRRLGPSLWLSEDSWSLEDREQALRQAVLTGTSHSHNAVFRLILALF